MTKKVLESSISFSNHVEPNEATAAVSGNKIMLNVEHINNAPSINIRRAMSSEMLCILNSFIMFSFETWLGYVSADSN